MGIKTLILPITSLCISLFYGWLVLLFISYKIIKTGRKFFAIKRTTEAPKEAFDPKYGNHNFVLLKNQGIRLHYVESGSSNNPMMLMIHGFPDFWYSWRHQIPKFSDKYWVVAVDMRGYGDSDQPRHIKDYKMNSLVADMKELILALGKDSATIVAHDWGGVIAWKLAEKEPEIVKKLIILNAPNVRSKFLKRSWKQFLMSWYVFFFQLPYLPEFYLSSNNLEPLRKIYQEKGKEYCTDEEFEMYHFTFSQPGAFTSPINYYRANFNITQSAKNDANDRIKCPTLIIWGDQDKALSTELADKAAEHCDKANVVKITAGHWVHHERPDLVNKHILDFTKI